MSQVQNPKQRVIAINAAGGTVVLISSSKFARYVEIVECAPNGATYNGTNFSPTGINYNLPDDGYVATYALLPAQTLPIGDNSWKRDKAVGVPTGMTDPAGNAIGPQGYVKMISATASATQVLVREWS